MKKISKIIIVLVIGILLAGCTKSSASKFKKEYESLQNKLSILRQQKGGIADFKLLTKLKQAKRKIWVAEEAIENLSQQDRRLKK